MKKHNEQYNKRKVAFIEAISFLIGFSSSLFIYIASEYFKEASGNENVGLFYGIAYAIVLFSLLNLHKLVKKLGKSNIFYFTLLAKITAIVSLIFLPPSFFSVGVLVAYITLEALQWVSLDVILESFSKDVSSGRIRGLHLTIFNTGFILAPFLSTKILDNFGFSGVFLALLLFNAIVFAASLVVLRNVNHHFEQDLNVKSLLQKTWKRKDIMKIYYVSFVLECFYALMIIFTTINLRDLGFSWSDIGKMFTIMLIPFVLFQYPLGVLADKKIGEKELLAFAIFIMAVATIAIGFTESKSFAVWAGLLFFTRVGASFIEILRDSYFYKRIDGHDVDLINFFRTAAPVGYIISAGLSSLILIIFPLKMVFAFTAVVILSALFPVFHLEDSKSEREIKTAA